MIVSTRGRQGCLARGTALALGVAGAGKANAKMPYQPESAPGADTSVAGLAQA